MKKALLAKLFIFLTITGIHSQDGQIDRTFNTKIGVGFDNKLAHHLLQADGKILVAGSFISYDYTGKNRITRLNTDGTLDNSFDIGTGPNADITGIVLQADGKILITGSFTSFNGISRNGIARLNVNGSLDTTFDAGTGSNFYTSINVQSDGKILIGGFFSSYNNIAVNNIARLNSDGSLDTNFNQGSGANTTVRTIVVKSDGKILLVGDFTSFNGTSRISIAQLNPDGTLDTSFNPGNGANSSITCISIQTDGKILIGGAFSTYNFASRNRIARINTDGTVDATFNPSGLGINNVVYSMYILTNGKIIIGGEFSQHDGISRNNITRVNADGTFDTTFNPGTGTNQRVSSIVSKPDGKILISGNFTSYNDTSVGRFAQLNIDGVFDTSFFNPNGIGTGSSNPIIDMALQADGKILIGLKYLSTYNGVVINRLARLNADGTLDTTFNPGTGPSSTVWNIAIQPDGKIIVVGHFSQYNGISRNGIVRINANGTIDTSFNVGTGVNNVIYSVAIQLDGKIIIGGRFSTYQGISRNRIARINTDGSLDTSFDIGIGVGIGTDTSAGIFSTSELYKVVVQPAGKILIGGSFNTFNAIEVQYLCRLNANGTLDTTFNTGGTGPDSEVDNIVIQSDGKIYIAGNFLSSYNGVSSKAVARLNSNGIIDSTFTIPYLFNPSLGTNFDGNVSDIAIQSDGKIIIVGDYYTIGGVVGLNISRLETNGMLDTTFESTTGIYDPTTNNSSVQNIIIQPDGNVLISGAFRLYNNITAGNIIRMLVDNNALSTEKVQKVIFKIYPNPSKGIFTIKTNTPTEKAKLLVSDLNGRIVHQSESDDLENQTFDVSGLQNGMYILTISNESYTTSQKIIKQ